MKAILLVALLLPLALAFTADEYQTTFTNWMLEQGKSYAAEEFQTRFAIFKSNMDYVRDWNAQGGSTILGLNAFADLSNAEYQKIYLGTRVTVSPQSFTADVQSSAPLADTINWATKGAVTPIKNQGQCGSCWSFSTTGSVEGAHFLAKGNLVSLSEQNLIDCSVSYGNEGCNGGLMDDAFKYIIANKGIDTEASYPYTTSGPNACKYNAANSAATISSYKNVAKSETALATAANTQPISVAIDASHNSFQLYTSGVYYEPACSTTSLDHGVLVVGYGTQNATTDYWIVKNSWGTSWGMSGYIHMIRNKANNCGIATQASYPIV